jgi:uncharacterized membrane protein YjfL (UPF0719 family)
MTGQALGMLILDFVIVFAVLLCARVLYGLVAGIDVTEEMAGKNNHAVGISLAGATAGIGIMLSGVVTGTFSSTLGAEALSMVVYAAVGLVLMWLTRLIFDKVSLPSFSVKDEIARGNNAVAIVDAGNMVATAVMVRAVMNWSEGALSSGLMAVAVGYVATQVILTLTTVYRIRLFRMRNREGAGFQDVVRAGNMAVAMRFVGFQVGVALAVTAASGVAVFQAGGDPIVQGLTWGGVSIVMAVILALLALVAERSVLAKINVAEEVDRQQNIGVALMEVGVYVAIGLILTNLLA